MPYNKKIIITGVALLFFLPAGFIHAQQVFDDAKNNLGKVGVGTGLVTEANKGDADIYGRLASYLNVLLGLVGIIATIYIIFAGIRWIRAGGNEQSVTEAKDRIKNAIIGLAVVFMAWIIVGFTVEQLKTATGGGSGAVPTVDGTVKPQ